MQQPRSNYYLDKAYNKNTSPAGNYMFKVNNRDARKSCEICSKLTIKIPIQGVNIFHTLY